MRWLLVWGCLIAIACSTPLASAFTPALSGDIVAEATGPSGAVVTYDDDEFTCTPPSGSTFPLGDTIVNCVDEDSKPVGSFKVSVVDTTAPAISGVPGDITVDSSPTGGTVVTYTSPTSSDVVDGPVPVNCTPPSGSTFPVGITTVNCAATDSHGNSSSASFKVTVLDKTPPLIEVPADITAEATGPGGAAVTYTVTFSDPDDSIASSGCTPASGSTFSLGSTTVNCTATDSHGNSSSASFNITVHDTTPPVISGVPADIVKEGTSPSGAVVDYTNPSATDAVDGSVPVNCSPPSGSTFPFGPTTVNCTAADSHGNSSTASFTVTVVDVTAPRIDVPADITVDATGPGGAIVSYTVTFSDPDDPVADSGCAPASGSTFPFGTTTVNCSATDSHGNSSSASFKVTVVDRTAPRIDVPADMTVDATGPGGATVTYTVTFSDPDDPITSSDCTPASGSTFPFGTTTVNCTAADSHGNSSSASFMVTVLDRTKPRIDVPPDITAEATGPSGADVPYTVTFSDPDDPITSSSCTPASGSTFALGTTTVNCTAADSHGNSSSASFKVTVRDTTPPAFSHVPGPITVEANGPSGSIVNFTNPTAVDLVDGPKVVTCVPLTGAVFELGKTKVTCSATDSRGNTGSTSFQVTVVDTTPPNLLVPVATSVHATTPTGIPDTVSSIVSFLSAASARDIVDPAPVVTNNALSFLPVGTLTIIFTARDHSGNSVSREVTLIVLPMPPPGTPPLPVPKPPVIPSEVKNLKVVPRNGGALITWNAGGSKVKVIRSSSSTRSLTAVGDEQVVYTGTASRYLDRGLQNGVEYRYVVRAVDAAGNESAGVAAVVVPRRDLLRSPKDGARLRKAPKLVWAADPAARYYNAQVLLNGVKILSVWPTGPSYVLKKRWKYNGRTYKLKPGTYTWYVWPGHGVRSAVDYGELMGSRTFRIVP